MTVNHAISYLYKMDTFKHLWTIGDEEGGCSGLMLQRHTADVGNNTVRLCIVQYGLSSCLRYM